MVGFIWLLIIGSVIWVGIDSHRLGMKRGRLGGGPIDMGTTSWVLACLVIWIIGFPAYMVARTKYQALSQPVLGYGSDPAFLPSQYPGYQQPASQQPASQQPVVQQAPPQYSPDGQWWWTGTEWVPVQR